MMEGLYVKRGEAELKLPEKTIRMPIFEGSEGEKGFDISALRKETGYITYDPGLVNTGSCDSQITYIDGEKGILRHRGYDIEDLAESCYFLEVAYLLIHGKLPTKKEYDSFSKLMNRNSMIHEDMHNFFRNYPEGAHPMAVLSAMVVSLSSFYPEIENPIANEDMDMTVTRLLSKLRTIAAFSYKKSVGEPFVYPSHKYTYCENFLNMMFNSPVRDYKPDPVAVRALNLYLTIHADHEQNCSTSVVRFVGSAGSNLYASISAGICALWGPLHGGANEAVVNMIEGAIRDKLSPESLIAKSKDKASKFRLMGFGHRVYKAYDPRAKIAKRTCKKLLEKLGSSKDPIFEYAMELEDKALKDQYFVDKHLYPNVDFYTGIGYRAMGIPTSMFTVLFALGRLPGWIAQWLEMRDSKAQKIGRPRQIYTGPVKKEFIPLDKR